MDAAEKRARDIVEDAMRLDPFYYVGSGELEWAITKALRGARREALEEAAQFIEDDRYNLANREAEWSRFIARKVRALAERTDG